MGNPRFPRLRVLQGIGWMCDFPPMSRRTSPDSSLLFDFSPARPDLRFEREANKSGFKLVAGADEAGRGPLAGPVVAAAVILDIKAIPPGLDDSKKLTKAKRETLYAEIMATAFVAIASTGPSSIDRTDIRKASLDAMRRAMAALAPRPDFGLFDGRDVPDGLHCMGKSVIKGDARSLSIAAASIIAKVTRDRMMDAADDIFPGYGFTAHSGYGTAQHLAALKIHGPCQLHRMSFRPIRQE